MSIQRGGTSFNACFIVFVYVQVFNLPKSRLQVLTEMADLVEVSTKSVCT